MGDKQKYLVSIAKKYINEPYDRDEQYLADINTSEKVHTKINNSKQKVQDMLKILIEQQSILEVEHPVYLFFCKGFSTPFSSSLAQQARSGTHARLFLCACASYLGNARGGLSPFQSPRVSP